MLVLMTKIHADSLCFRMMDTNRIIKVIQMENILRKCIPGCDSFEKESDSIFNATATNQIGPMNATFSGKVILSNIKKRMFFTIFSKMF